MKLLLDTCTFLWIASDSSKLSKTAMAAFMDRENIRYLSAASVWEISIKYAAGRLPLEQRPDQLVPRIRAAAGIASQEVDEECALLAGRLASFHSDPFDRMIVAQAIIHGMAIVTPDKSIEQYAVRVLW